MNDKLHSALAQLEAVQHAFPVTVVAMKTKLVAWVDANTGPDNDAAVFTSALLELGIERLLKRPYANENAFENLKIFSRRLRA
jgi:hypothetical protein